VVAEKARPGRTPVCAGKKLLIKGVRIKYRRITNFKVIFVV
jgi:hypothetical protein